MSKVSRLCGRVCLCLLVPVATLFSATGPANNGQIVLKDRVVINPRWGTPEVVWGRFPTTDRTDFAGAAYSFIAERADLFRLERPASELRISATTTDDLGHTHVKFQQVCDGLRVWGCQTIVHFDAGGAIHLVGGQTLPTPSLSTTPLVSRSRAVPIALTWLRDTLASCEPDTDEELLIYPTDGRTVLSWLVTVRSSTCPSVRWRVFVDAGNGGVIRCYNDVYPDGPLVGWGYDVHDSVRTLQVYELSNYIRMIDATRAMYTPPADSLTGVIASYIPGMSGPAWDLNHDTAFIDVPDYKPAVSAHHYASLAYEYFQQVFSRNSWNDSGGSVHCYANDDTEQNNAFWMGNGVIAFGPGDTVNYLAWSGALDVVAHEFTHGVTETSAGLLYQFQTGALNESFSDFFGAMVDRDDWLIAEDIALFEPGFLRNMADPHQGAIPDLFPFGYQPAHMSEYVDRPIDWDFGAVHINSGIPNKVGYLVSEAIGREQAEQIWYRTLTTYLTPYSSFYYWGLMTAQAAVDLHGLPSAQVTAVYDALDSVGITSIFANPHEIDMTVQYGFSTGATLTVISGLLDSVVVDSVWTTIGLVELTSGLPDTLIGYDSTVLSVSFDAGGLTVCDMGLYEDTVIVTTTSLTVPMIRVPVVVNVGSEGYGFQIEGIGQSVGCGQEKASFVASNTTAMEHYFRDDVDGLYDGSLFIGLVHGTDTIVYRHLYDDMSIPPDCEFLDSVNYKNSTQCEYVDFATDGARILGKLQYYGWWNLHCGEIVAEYVLRNECDTPLTIVTGVFCDFDVPGDAYRNVAGYVPDKDLVYVSNEYGNRVLAIASLTGTVRNLRAINNPTVIWPHAGLPIDTAYAELMTTTNTDGPTPDDWSVLLTFDTVTIGAGDTVMYRAALLHANDGISQFDSMLADLAGFADSAYLFLGHDSVQLHVAQGDPNPPDTAVAIRYVVNFLGGNPVFWSASNGSSWLSLDKYAGQTDDTIRLSFDISEVTAGIYFDTVLVHADSAVNSPETLIVQLRVNPGTGVVSVPGLHLPTIQSGINVAFGGDTILVGPGEYIENLIIDKPVRVRSTHGWRVTTLSPASTSQLTIRIYDDLGPDAEFTGFTVTGGRLSNVLHVGFGNTALIADNYFHNPNLRSTRAVLTCHFIGPTPLITGNIFRGNAGKACVDCGMGTIVNNTFIDNATALMGGDGGGVARNNIIAGSSAYGILGGFADQDCNNLWNNDTSYGGGAVAGPNDVSGAPMFCHPGAGNFDISSASVCAPDNNDCAVVIGAGDVGCDSVCAYRGDADHGGGVAPVNVADITYLCAYLFLGGPVPPCYEEGDADADNFVTVADVTFLVSYLFQGGPAPSPCS